MDWVISISHDSLEEAVSRRLYPTPDDIEGIVDAFVRKHAPGMTEKSRLRVEIKGVAVVTPRVVTQYYIDIDG